MKRLAIQSLRKWRQSTPHKPIIMRGARQVGKTYLAETFGKEFDHFVGINLEKEASLIDIFEGDLDPQRLTRLISLHTEKKIIPGKTLLFIDEIQEAPRAITALRYFYEEMPELHVIAAGSLLEFAIEQVGVPVGRINFLYIYPLSFIEFLLAQKREQAIETILNHKFPNPMEPVAHNQLIAYLSEYFAIGGMPEAVNLWCEQQDLQACQLVHQSIIQTYRQDFSKYAKKHQIKYLELLFRNIPHQACRQFNYSKVPGEYRKRDLMPALNLLEQAGIIAPVYHSAGQGIPIESQANYEIFKCIFIDIALAQTILGYDLRTWFFKANDTFINKGEITEMFVGQEMLAYANPLFDKKLYYWQRQERNAQAEVDYLLHYQDHIIPVEVKSGASTKLKSMRAFLENHPHSPYGMRFWPPSYSMEGNIHSYPLYSIASILMQQEFIESMV